MFGSLRRAAAKERCMFQKARWHRGCGHSSRDCEVAAAFGALCHPELLATGWPSGQKRLARRLAVTLSRQISQEEWIMRSKRLSTYLFGAGLALSVAAFAPAAFAQDTGTNGSTAGSSSSSMAPNSEASPGAATDNSGGMTSPSGPVSGSASSATNPNSAASPAMPNGSMGSSNTSPGSSNSTSGGSTNTAP